MTAKSIKFKFKYYILKDVFLKICHGPVSGQRFYSLMVLWKNVFGPIGFLATVPWVATGGKLQYHHIASLVLIS